MVSLRCQGVLLRTCSRNQPRWHHRAHERPIDVLLSMWVTVLRPVSLVGCECRVHCQIQKNLHTCPRCRRLRRTIEWVLQALFPPPCICPRRVAGVSFECVVVMIVDDSKHFLCFHASVCWRPIVVFFLVGSKLLCCRFFMSRVMLGRIWSVEANARAVLGVSSSSMRLLCWLEELYS